MGGPKLSLPWVDTKPWVELSIVQYAATIALVAVGQSLNFGIYRAIGIDGVYYGIKLGKRVPWVTGFPFSVCPHPQYVGSVMTILGLAALLWNHAPQGLGVIVVYWASLYVVTAVVEDNL